MKNKIEGGFTEQEKRTIIPDEVNLPKDKIKITASDGKKKLVDVLATINENELPLPTFEQLKDEYLKAIEMAKNNDEEHPWINDEETPHIHSEEIQGKIYINGPFDGQIDNVNSFTYVPYYSYEWSHPQDMSGADNFPIIEKNQKNKEDNKE